MVNQKARQMRTNRARSEPSGDSTNLLIISLLSYYADFRIVCSICASKQNVLLNLLTNRHFSDT